MALDRISAKMVADTDGKTVSEKLTISSKRQESVIYLVDYEYLVPSRNVVLKENWDWTEAIKKAFDISSPDALPSELPVEFPNGTINYNEKIPFTRPFYGQGNRATKLKALSTFIDTMMVDFNAGGERKYIKGIRFDASRKASVQIFGSSGDAEGSSQSIFEDIWFTDTADGVYAVGGSSVGVVGGMLTGAIFLRCSWNGCAQWLNVGQNQDDVTFINCRFTMDGQTPGSYVISVQGNNVKFQGGYADFSNTNHLNGSIKVLIRIGSWSVRFENFFFESHTGTNTTHVFHCTDPNTTLSLETIHLNLYNSPSVIALIRNQVESITGTRKHISTKNFTKYDSGTYKILDLYVNSNSAGKHLFWEFFGVDNFNELFQFASGSTTTLDDLSIRLLGVFKGKTYNGGFSTKRGLSVIKPVSSDESAGIVTNEASIFVATNVSPLSTNYTLPSAGVWLISVTALVNGSKDHMANGNYIVTYYDSTFDTLAIDQIGTSKFSSGSTYGVDSLTVSVPNQSGQITLTVGWTNGSSQNATFVLRARKLSDFAI